jgi:hypothetical protein
MSVNGMLREYDAWPHNRNCERGCHKLPALYCCAPSLRNKKRGYSDADRVAIGMALDCATRR